MSTADTGTAPPRVGLVGSPRSGGTYERLDQCAFEVMAVVPTLAQVNPTLLTEYDVMLVGCTAEELEDPAFQAQVRRVARIVHAIAVVPGGGGATTAARLGFRGFIAREVAPDALSRTVGAVAGGEVAFPRATLAPLLQMLSLLPVARAQSPYALTPRQQQIVDLIAEGATDREIATRLQISEATAHKHVQNALRRSNTKTRSQLVAVARASAGA
ncbi:MAG: LuxR C-terminal-related transcriptional regulator [Candidatus Limnocylindria bacterium]